MQRNDFDKALNLAYFYLKFRPRTTREVELYLARRAKKYNYAPEVISEVIARLREQNYLDDKKFAEMFVHDRLLFKPRSTLLIRHELSKLGIPKDIIDSVLIPNPAGDIKSAVELLKKKENSLTHLPEKKRFVRAIRYLRGKGFSYGDSVSAYREIIGKNEKPFEDLSPTE